SWYNEAASTSLTMSWSSRARPNNSFKPNLLRSTKAMAKEARHGFGSTTQVGLTQVLALMDASTVIITALGTIALLVAVAFPVWVAWIVAWRSKMERSARRSFLLACLLMSYGGPTLTGALLLAFEMATVYIARAMHADGSQAR